MKKRYHPLEDIERENIKITDIRVRLFSCQIPVEKYWWGCGIEMVTEILTDVGIVGVGPPGHYGGGQFIKNYTEKVIKQEIVGKNLFDVGLHDPSAKSFRRSCAWAGVTNACWDVIGKAKSKPVYRLLSDSEDLDPQVKHYASCGTLHDWKKRPEDLIDEALKYKEEGFASFKFRLGESFRELMNVKTYASFLRKLRESVGWDFDLMHERGLSFYEMKEFCPVLEELRFFWLEEPCQHQYDEVDRESEKPLTVNQAIARTIELGQLLPTVKIAGSETFVTRYDFNNWIDRDAYDIIQFDCSFTGLTEAWYIARMAHERGKLVVNHNWQSSFPWLANIHFTASNSKIEILEYNNHYNPFRDDGIFTEPIRVENGFALVPEKPGLGVDIIEDAEKKFPYEPATDRWSILS